MSEIVINKIAIYGGTLIFWFVCLFCAFGMIAIALEPKSTITRGGRVVCFILALFAISPAMIFTIDPYDKARYKATEEYIENKEIYSTLLNNGYSIIGEFSYESRAYPSTEPCENPETLKFFNRKYEEVKFSESKTAICK